MPKIVFNKIVYYMVIVFIIAMNNYVISVHYSPDTFNRTKLLQKKFRCIRYYQDTNDYNKHMEKTCVIYKDDNKKFMDEKTLYEKMNKIAMCAGLLIVRL